MIMFASIIWRSCVALTLAGSYALCMASDASAFTFMDDGGVQIGSADIGQSFKVSFDGNVSTQNVSQLSSEAIFKFLGFSTLGSTTQAQFEVSLENLSRNGIVSRTSALGFNAYGLAGSQSLGLQEASLKNPEDSLFANANLGGKFPNAFGNLDVCFINNRNNCSGGASGGVETGEPAQSFAFSLDFNGPVEKVALSYFGVRYQSIDGTSDGKTYRGDSGTGRGTVVRPPNPSQPERVPEPMSAAALGIFAVSLLLKGLRCAESIE